MAKAYRREREDDQIYQFFLDEASKSTRRT